MRLWKKYIGERIGYFTWKSLHAFSHFVLEHGDFTEPLVFDCAFQVQTVTWLCMLGTPGLNTYLWSMYL